MFLNNHLTPSRSILPRLAAGAAITAAALAVAAAPAVATPQAQQAQPQGQARQADAQPQPVHPVTAEEQRAVVDRLAELLAERYVFEDKGIEAGQLIQRRLEEGAYRELTEPQAFSRKLTEELQAVTRDKHLRVGMPRRPGGMAGPGGPGRPSDPGELLLQLPAGGPADNFGFEKIQFLPGNVGYLKLNGFAGNPAAREIASAAMNFLAGCDALIIDLRDNGGGNPDLIRYLSSYLFDQPTHLNSLYWREGDRTEEFWTLSDVPGRRLGQDVPMFVLTSNYTFSGGEEFAYNIQTQKRGTLIGETTGGGANPGGGVRVGERFMAFIPTGRAINPITKTNWEGVGVEPEIKLSREEAYDKGVELATAAAEERRGQRQAEVVAARRAVVEALRAAAASASSADADLLSGDVRDALDQASAHGALREMELNIAGYEYLQAGQTPVALALLRYNAERYPESANAHDSLGEALEKAGRLEEAKACFERAIDLAGEGEDSELLSQFRQHLDRVTAAIQERGR